MILGLRTTIFKVPDLNAAKAWYTKAFDTEPYFDQPIYAGFSIGGYELGLLSEEVPSEAKSDHVTTYWGVEDIEKEYRRLVEIGAAEHEKPVNVSGDIVTASVLDPWNNVIGLIYNPEFKFPE